MFLSWGRPEIDCCEIEPALRLTIGVVGNADRARFANALEPRRDIDAVAHEVAVALLDHVAQVNADAKFDAFFGRQAGVALDHAGLHFDRAPYSVDHAAELDDRAVAGALDDSAVMDSDGRVDKVAGQRGQPRQRALFVGTGEPAIPDDIRNQNRC
jgi:hypothetical protein